MSSIVKDTPIEDIPQVVEGLRASFLTGKTRSVEYRQKQLKQLLFMIADNEEAFLNAIQQDLGRPKMETGFAELITIKNEIIDVIHQLPKWSKPSSVYAGPAYAFHKKQILKQPKGTVLILGAWNYPITVQLGPVVGAIAAGNTVVLKPSEISPHSAQLIADLWAKYIDPDLGRVVNGGVDQSTALLDQRYEHIFYTGNGRIGRLIAEKAARWLCPTTLELGGKSPVIVDRSANLPVAAHRVLWSKTFNSGQTCIAPDYVLVERSVQDQFAAELVNAAKEFFPTMDKNVRDMGRIVSERHWKRVFDLLSSSKGEVVFGGSQLADQSSKFLPLTILKNVSPSDSTMSEELFCPILPLLPVDNVHEAIDFVNSRDQPLAMYVFASKSTTDYILTYTRSGAAVRGDLLLHYVINELPFGGTGPSGYGVYHGKASFDCFTHERAFVDAPASGFLGGIVEKIMSMRYPPYSANKLAFFHYALAKAIPFGRPTDPVTSSTNVNNPVSKSVRSHPNDHERL